MQQNIFQTIIAIILIPILLFIIWRIRRRKLARYDSPILGKIEVLQKYNKELLLTINDYDQGVSIEHPTIKNSYFYCIAAKTLKAVKGIKNPKILMLGLGANTVSSLIANKNPKIHQTIVEIDKQIIQACKEYFELEKLPNYTIINKDAYKLMVKRLPKKYDVIITDIFTGKKPFISLESNEPQFIDRLILNLKPKGTIIFNRVAHSKEMRQGGVELKKYLSRKFEKVTIFDIKDSRGYRNYVIIGTKKKT